MKVENKNVVEMIKKWYLGGTRGGCLPQPYPSWPITFLPICLNENGPSWVSVCIDCLGVGINQSLNLLLYV